LKSGEWFFLFVILDHHFLHAIHLNDWSKFPRPPLVTIGFLASEGPILCTGERAKTVLLAVRGMTLSTVKVAMIVSATVVATILFLAALEPTGSEVLRGMSWSMAEMAMTQSTATWVWTFCLAGVGTTPSKGQVDAISFMAASGGTLFQAGMGAIGCLAATAMIL